MVNTTVKEVTNPVAGQDDDHAGGTDWNQAVQVMKGTHGTERIQSSSIQYVAWVTKSAASQTLGAAEEYVLADATGNAVTITLPSAVDNLGGHYRIKKIDASLSNLVTINTTSSQTIDGKLSTVLNDRNEVIDVISDGSNWRVGGRKESNQIENFRAKGATLNRWYTYEMIVNTASTTSSAVAATMYAFPVLITKTTTIDSVAINVTTVGSGSSVNTGIYADNGNLYPGVLVQDFGNIATAVGTGVKSFSTGLPLTLLPGLYWLVYLASATAPVVSGYVIGQLYPILGTTSVLTVAHGVGWSVAQAAGALPASFTAGGAVIIAVPLPAVFWRTSG